jgi:signal transduction histidine kinase
MAEPDTPEKRSQHRRRLTPRGIALLYSVAGCIWILLSDRVAVAMAGGNASFLGALQTYKGWFYVLATGVLLYFLVRSSNRELEQMAAELRLLNDELERRVRDRTSRLQAAVAELEAFSYSVSHDLRAPVRSMSGFSRILLEDYGETLPPEGRHYLERIRAAAEEMGALIGALLDLSRLSRQPLQVQPVDLRALAERAVEVVRPDADGRDVRFVVSELPQCRGDPTLLLSVLTNLLANAVKFSRGASPALIEVGTTSDDARAVVYVRDNGEGFDMRCATKLFGVFQRLHRADEYEGNGVGLATVQRIVHRHGGAVWAEAEIGKGATFYFTLGETCDS